MPWWTNCISFCELTCEIAALFIYSRNSYQVNDVGKDDGWLRAAADLSVNESILKDSVLAAARRVIDRKVANFAVFADLKKQPERIFTKVPGGKNYQEHHWAIFRLRQTLQSIFKNRLIWT